MVGGDGEVRFHVEGQEQTPLTENKRELLLLQLKLRQTIAVAP
jgi:hypothetical protein